MKSYAIRQSFIDFFKSKEHAFIKASPVLPVNDPSLLFVNAGMNQFKPFFLGTENPNHKRAVNSQPCIRVSGKHNDLEDVGIDTYHHTCFEMLGNWSFGDYYKKEAIVWAWELLISKYKMNKDHIVVTVYEDDEEAFELWKTHTEINENSIVRCGKKDNFWEMGATGPCGPCSEIHIDLTPELGGKPVQDPITKGLTDRYMELWNLVFIQHDRQVDGSLKNLPSQHIDTGAGLERLTAHLQGVKSNYDTDCFQSLITRIEKELGVNYSEGLKGVAHRVISDHIRTVTFAIADNVMPSNEGRGYVLRRLIRRALRFASQAGKNDAFLHTLIPIVNESFNGHYDHINDRLTIISEQVKFEEEQFLRTVQSGLKLFHQVIIDLKDTGKKMIDGETAFKLYDTHGFPLDLTEVMAKERGVQVNIDGFQMALNRQKEQSRKSRKETLSNGIDDTITSQSDICNDVHEGLYKEQPGGGEARIPANNEQRFGIAQNHTATHLLNASLRHVLGSHIQQAGSLVDINRLRFDFTHNSSITKSELLKINQLVNEWIRSNKPVKISDELLDKAKERGAIAMFGEKYDDMVRVVEIPTISIELCGGNHVKEIKDLEIFQITNEGNIAAGTRRIEAIVGKLRVNDWNNKQQNEAYAKYKQKYNEAKEKIIKLDETESKLPELKIKSSMSLHEIDDEVNKLVFTIKNLEKEIKKEERNQAVNLIEEMLENAKPLKSEDGIGLIQVVKETPIPVLKELADRLVSKLGDSIVILGSSQGNKAHAVVKVSHTLINKYQAPKLIKELTSITGGGGGGRDHMAQAGGVDNEKLSDGITQMRKNYII